MERNVPRGACTPKHEVVVYFTDSNGKVAGNIKYGWTGNLGLSAVGTFDGSTLPAGTYKLKLVNQKKTGTAHATVHIYTTSQYLSVY